MTSLTRSALSGVVWNWAGSGVVILAQVGSTAATARLVSPAEFGVYATAQAAAGFAGYLTMMAVGHDLQRRSELKASTIGTAFSISLAASAAIAAAFLIGAEAWADLWGVPKAAPVVRIFSIVVFFTSVSAVPLGMLRRNLAFRRAAAAETTSLVFGLAVGVALAAMHHSAAALAIGQAAGSLLLASSATLATWRVLRPRLHPRELGHLSTFGAQIGALGLVAYVANTAPSWFAATLFGPALLGVYSRAYLIVALPGTYISASILKVVYPMYGHVRDNQAQLRVLITEAITLTTGTVWPLFALVAGAAPVLVEVLLGDRWTDAAPYVTLVAVGICAYIPTELLTNAAEALGWIHVATVRRFIYLTAVSFWLLAGFVIDASLGSVLGGIAATQWLLYALTLWTFSQRGLIVRRHLFRTHVIHVTAAAAACFAAAGVTLAVSATPLALQALFVGATGALTVLILAASESRYPASRLLWARVVTAFPSESRPRLRGFGP